MIIKFVNPLLLAVALGVSANTFALDNQTPPDNLLLAAESESVTPTHEHNKVIMKGKTHEERETTEPSSEVKPDHEMNKVIMKGESHNKRETTEPSGDVDPTHQHNKVTMPGETHNP